MQQTETKGLRVCAGRGFQMFFQNGWGCSIQWGPGNYADCEGGRFGDFERPQRAAAQGRFWSADSAEVAVFVPDERATDEVCGNFLRQIDGDDVAGWVGPDNVAALLATVAGFTPETPESEARHAVQVALGRD